MSPASFRPFLTLFFFLLFHFSSSEIHSESLRRVLHSPDSDQSPVKRSPALAREFLEAHNHVRSKNKQPLFRWDRTLARHARRWGIKRAVDCKMIHSYGPYGENLFWGKKNHWTPKEAVESWASEQENYNANSNECSPGQMCGHYTQIVWKDSVKLGCARVKCITGGVLVICEYDPPGNFIDQNPFTTADAGSAANGDDD